MALLRKIAMKCTKAEYESIKEFVGELTNPSKDDFKSYNYLTNCSSAKTVYMISKGFVDHDKKIYETFDKDVFLKACGINPNKIIFDQVKEYFKDAVEVESLYGNSNFKIQDYDLNKMTIVIGDVFVESKCGNFSRSLHDNSGRYAKILSTNEWKLKSTINPSKNWLEDAIWSGGSSVTPEILRELTEPKNEAKRLKVGGIYKANETDMRHEVLFKVTQDDGIEIHGYGFVNGKFIKKRCWYKGECINGSRARLKETTIEKWEKSLLKYKK